MRREPATFIFTCLVLASLNVRLLAETNIPVRLPNGELNRAHPWAEDHQLQGILQGAFRGILAIETPDPTNKVFTGMQDAIFSVALEDWSEYDLGEQEFTRLMGKAGATPSQAWEALRFSHRLRTSCGQLTSHYFAALDPKQSRVATDETTAEIDRLSESTRRILKRVERLSAKAPLGTRLAAYAKEDLRHSGDALREREASIARQWAKDAERTAKSAEALANLEIERTASNKASDAPSEPAPGAASSAHQR